MKTAPLTLFSVMAGLLLGNLLVSLLLGLGDAEALYYTYSLHLQGAYLDHPPLIGWLIRASTALFGHTVLGVRAVPMVMMSLGLVFTFQLTRALFGDGAARLVPLLILATPVFSIGLTAATPDAPLFAIWPLYLWQLYVAIERRSDGRGARFWRPLFLGGLLGLAFLAKYTGVLLLFPTLVLLLRKPNRVWLRRPGFWAGALAAAAIATPVFLWNIDHGWAGAFHRLEWTQGGAGFSIRNAGALVGGQLLYIGPVMLLLFYRTVRRALDAPVDTAHTLILSAALPVLALTYLLALWSDVAEPHWPAPGYLALYPAAAALVHLGSGGALRLFRIALSLGIAVYIIMLLLVVTPALPVLSPEESYQPKYDLANELRGWPEVAEAIRAVDRDRRPVVAAFYTQCAQLTFALNRPEDPPVRCISKERDDFDIWYEPFELPEKGALFVTDNRFDHDVEALLPGVEVGATISVDIRRADVPVRRFRITECH